VIADDGRRRDIRGGSYLFDSLRFQDEPRQYYFGLGVVHAVFPPSLIPLCVNWLADGLGSTAPFIQFQVKWERESEGYKAPKGYLITCTTLRAPKAPLLLGQTSHCGSCSPSEWAVEMTAARVQGVSDRDHRGAAVFFPFRFLHHAFIGFADIDGSG
jgi:hypothetical protein